MISVDEALDRILTATRPLAEETVPLSEAAGRALAAPLIAAHDQPPFDASAMDGYAIRAADIAAGQPLRLIGTAQAGQHFAGMVNPGQCVRIFTGAPLPIGADTVVVQEEATAHGNEISFSAFIKPGAFIRRRGSVFAESAALLPAGTPLTPGRLSLAAAANRAVVTVRRRPRLVLVATGDELVPPGTPLGPDQIVSANSAGLSALFSPFAEVIDFGIVRDDLPALVDALRQAFTMGIDMLVTTGGASLGDHDYMREALASLGVGLDFWQIAMRPGKPLMFGRKDAALVFGLPGNPVSALATSMVMVLPALRQLAGHADPFGFRLGLPLAAPLPANGARRHFLRGRIEPTPSGPQIMPINETDSGHILSMAQADALIVQPENNAGMPAGTTVEVILL